MNASNIFSYLKETYQEWSSDDAFEKSSSIAYYSVFSLPGLLIIIVTAAHAHLESGVRRTGNY